MTITRFDSRAALELGAILTHTLSHHGGDLTKPCTLCSVWYLDASLFEELCEAVFNFLPT